jgi:acetyltransferase-like isoleucine patch superfamily enzyme
VGLDWILKLANFGRVAAWRLRLAWRGGRIGRRCAIAPGVRLECGRGRPIVLGDGVRLLRGVRLSTAAGGRIVLEDRVYVGEYGTVLSAAEIRIARDTIIAPHAHIEDFDAAKASPEHSPLAANPIRIGRDVWFGAGVTVRRGVQVGDQAVLGAGAVADRDIPDRGVAVGVPAQVVRFRGDSSEKGKSPA